VHKSAFRTDSFNRECAAEGPKQTGCIKQMTVRTYMTELFRPFQEVHHRGGV
jgi:hypothetical protein